MTDIFVSELEKYFVFHIPLCMILKQYSVFLYDLKQYSVFLFLLQHPEIKLAWPFFSEKKTYVTVSVSLSLINEVLKSCLLTEEEGKKWCRLVLLTLLISFKIRW